MKKKIIILITAILVTSSLAFFYNPAKAAVFHIIYNLKWTNGLVGYWTMDGKDVNWATGKVTDSSSGGNTGQLIGLATSTAPVPGIVGQALKFDGVNDYVDIGTNLNASLIRSKTFSISAWVKSNSNAADVEIITNSDASSPYTGIEFHMVSGNFRFDLNQNATKSIRKTTSVTINDGVWHDVIVTYDGSGAASGINFYIDGGLVSATTNYDTTDADTTSTTNLQIGVRDGTTSPWQGSIDEVRVYNRALSAAEIKYHYEKTAPQFRSQINKSFKDKWTNGLVGYWSFDGHDMNWAVASSSIDRSGQGNNGAPVGMATSTAPTSGVVGQALKFDGVKDYIQISDSGRLNFNSATNDFTACGWTKRANTGQTHTIIDDRDANDDGWRFIIGGDNLVYGSIDAIDVGSASAITDANWHYFCFVADRDANGQIYMDGIANGSPVAINSEVMDIAINPKIGRSAYASDSFFDGQIDEVRIYNRALSAAEILEQYESTAPQHRSQINAPQTDKFKNGLVGYWSFDGSKVNWATGKVTDSSGNNNTGQILGMATSTAPVPGVVGQALWFGKAVTGERGVRVPYASSLEPTTITVSMWCYVTDLARSNCEVGSYSADVDYSGYSLHFPGGGNNKFYFDGGNGVTWPAYSAASNAISKTDWYYVVGIHDSNNHKIYINGSMETSAASGALSPMTWENLYFGFDIGNGHGGGPSTGNLDEVRIYNRVLSAAEIYELYRAGRR